MKLHRLCDVVPDSTGMLCRQSRLGSVVLAVIFSLPLIGLPIYSWWADKNRGMGVVLAVAGVVIIPLLIANARLTFRPSNWLAWIRFDSLWINARPYQDQSPTDELCVVQLEYREIAEVSQHADSYTTPDSHSRNNSVKRKLTSLDIRLNPADAGPLEAMLAAVQHRPQPVRTYLGFIKSTAGAGRSPVSLPEPDLIRVAWLGGVGHGAVPSLRRVLAELAPWVKVGEPTRHDEKDWRELSDDEFRAQVLRLVKAGDRFGATDLLARRRGLTTTQAIQFIDELGRRVD
jgi:hypothetical protein